MSVPPIQFVPAHHRELQQFKDVELANLGLPPEDDLQTSYPEVMEEQTSRGLQIIFEDVEMKEDPEDPMNSQEYRENEMLANNTYKAMGGGRAVAVFLGGVTAFASGAGLLCGGMGMLIKTNNLAIGLLGIGGGSAIGGLGLGSIIDILRLKEIPRVISNRQLTLAAMEVLLAGGGLASFLLVLPD